MRILLLAQFYPPVVGGEERHVRNLGAALAARGHAVTVGTLWVPGAAAEEMDGAVRVVRLRGSAQRLAGLFSEGERRHAPPFPDPELVAGLAGLAHRVRPEVVHAHNWIVHAWTPLKPFFGVPLVQTLHDYSMVCAVKNLMRDDGVCAGPALGPCLACASVHYGRAVGMVTALGLRGSAAGARRLVDRFLAVSGAVAERNGLAGRAEVVPNFIPDGLGLEPGAGPSPAGLPDAPYMLFVGDLNRQKGVPVLLAAYASLPAPKPRLVLIGRRFPETSGPLPEGVDVFHGWPHQDVMAAWRGCLFGLAPSVWPEPCATVVLEGLAVGRPMIVTRTGGMPDMVQHEENGLLVAPGDVAGLAAAMRRLIDDPAGRARLGAVAGARVAGFRAGRVVDRIAAIYAELARPAGASAAIGHDVAPPAPSGTSIP